MTDNNPDPPKGGLRRIVRRTAWTVVGTVLLLAWYVLSYGATNWYLGHDTVRNVPRNGAEDFHAISPIKRIRSSTIHSTNTLEPNGRVPGS